MSKSTSNSDFLGERKRLVLEIKKKGVVDKRVLEAMVSVPRHLFVPVESRAASYEDGPLPIGFGQTISQPFIVAYMTEVLELKPEDRVLEIGTGSGYQSAVLSKLVSRVYSIEIIEGLARTAESALREARVSNVTVRTGDGYKGWVEEAPFDAIILTAAPPEIPQVLIEQLAEGGRLVAPVGETDDVQWLVKISRTASGEKRETLLPVRFVPMVEGSAQP